MKTIAKISEDTIKLISYIESLSDGQFLKYSQIQGESGVNMDTAGKSYLRTACKRLKREYSCIKGIGIELASEKTANNIIVHSLVKIDRTVRRAEKKYNNLTVSFYEKLSPQEQKQINFIGAAFGAIRVAAENGKHYIKRCEMQNNGNIKLPENIS